jgi:hypothetical protein
MGKTIPRAHLSPQKIIFPEGITSSFPSIHACFPSFPSLVRGYPYFSLFDLSRGFGERRGKDARKWQLASLGVLAATARQKSHRDLPELVIGNLDIF